MNETSGRLTVFTSEGVSLAKRYELDAEGKLTKRASANMTTGRYEVREFASIEDLATLIDGLSTKQAICASLPKNAASSGRVVCQAALPANPGAVARSKAHFALTASPGLLYLDHDSSGDGVGLDGPALWSLLLKAAPALASASTMLRPSGSSNICHGEADLTGTRGLHVFACLAEASDGPRVIKVIEQRLWLLGHGEIQLSSSGSMLLRGPVDCSVADPARLIFAAGAEAIAPLEQRRPPAVILSRGGWLDPRQLVPDLTRDEQARYEAAVESAKSAKLPEAMAVRVKHKATTVGKQMPAMLAAGVPAGEAEARISAAVDAAYSGLLLGDFELTAVHDDGRRQTVSVADILRDRERWHEVDFLVPGNEGHRDGSPDARAYLAGSSPIIYSLEGDVFRLRQQVEVLKTSKGSRSDLVEAISRVLADQDDCFMTDAGPVQLIEGRPIQLTPQRVQNLIGSRVALVVRGANGKDAPTDLARETADLVLAALV